MDTIHDFKKSTFCGCGCGNCVGVAIEQDAVFVTNTTAPGPIAKFTHDEWQAFIAGVKNGEFDLAR